ncbi:hypothetical protein [Methylobacter sp.]|uniref:hypothetical protein n=1 Tax=Methylobacter sp. TaxID=2051955 RepID=UPI002487E2B4|nr:hypothetical protein [Methylobacter sp.]MDI1279671.1 hypothetical protein [Methylobacter sp.]MDI1358564.1 hypothetical protein [Methylobacter sp.]
MIRTEPPVNSEVETTYSRKVNRVFKIGGAGISGASAGALIGSAIAGLQGALVGAIIVGGINMLLNAHNERSAC